ncbi:MAG: uroporphyrinogen decarboxylase family protein [Clostridia bacterium]|nr:uroporphyrinogen decarboxylase family protein [Clostridia bacterium]
MNSKELFLKAIHLKKTPRLPVALLSGGAWTFNRHGLSLEEALSRGAQESAQIIAATNEEADSDIVWAGSGYHNLAVRALGGKIKFRAKGTPDVQQPLIENVSIIDAIKLDRLADDPGINTLWETTKYLNKAVGEKTLIGASQWGPFTLAGLIYGVEKLMRNIYKNKEEINAVLEFTSELCFCYLEPFIEAGAGIISVADPTSSGDMISRSQFKEFSLPYLKKVVQKIRQKGAAVSIHICGNITNRLDLIPETGANIISVDYKVDLKQVREKVGGKIAFAGNMNPVSIMQNATPEGVAQACQNCINTAGPDSGYILMPGCDIPPGVPLENIKAMVATAKNQT